MYVVLFPYYFLQEVFALAFGVTVSEGAPLTFSAIHLITNYMPAIILIVLGWWLYRKEEGE